MPRLGVNARIAHYGPSKCAQQRGRIYVCSRTLKPEVINACKPGGVHIRVGMEPYRLRFLPLFRRCLTPPSQMACLPKYTDKSAHG